MKLLITTCLVFFCCTTVFSQHSYFYSDSSNNRSEIIAANRIKKDSIYSFNLKNGKVVDSFVSGSETFNQYGHKIEQRTLVSPKNGVFIIDSFFYNDKRQRLKYSLSTSLGGHIGDITYTLNGAGKEISSYDVLKSKDTLSISRSKKVYDAEGRLTEIYSYFDNDKSTYIRRFYYDNQGRVVKETSGGGKGEQLSSRTYVYEKNKITWYQGSKGKSHKNLEFFFNDAGQCIKITGGYGGYEARLTYNGDGTLYEWSSYKDGKKQKMDRHYYYK